MSQASRSTIGRATLVEASTRAKGQKLAHLKLEAEVKQERYNRITNQHESTIGTVASIHKSGRRPKND